MMRALLFSGPVDRGQMLFQCRISLLRQSVLGLLLAMSLLPRAAVAQDGPRILAIGDSLMVWHSVTGRSIPDVAGRLLGAEVSNRAISGARLLFQLPLFAQAGLQIRSQFTPGDWDWVLVNGGGNDLWFGCGCKVCDAKLDKMLLPDGSGGEVADLTARIRDTGARVLWFGYLRSPGVGSMIEECRDEGDEFEARLARFAEVQDGVFFISNADLVPEGDLSFHALDRVHPSPKASAAIGQRVADLIAAEGR
jgi:lysophospholipase L1-like esterase